MTTTRGRHPEPERRPQPAARSAAPPRTAPQTVLRWQATAGNAAVAGLLARGGGPASVVAQRDEEDGGSWWSRGIAAAKAAWRMKDQLTGVLGRGAGVAGSIVRSPVAFLGNLVAGVKGGILRFRANIGEHLKRGLMGWLLGALAEGGVQLPATFDAKGIVSMLASLFGLTWNAIRTRVVTRIGEGAMSAVEKGVEVFRLLSGQGVAGLWQMLLARLGNLQEMLLGEVREFVISRVLTAGVTWLIGILNPAAGIIKALKLIYDIVVFFRENAARLTKLVETVLDSISDVARGSVGAVVSKVESVLGGMVPTLIGFLASVIGLGGIGQRIRAIVERMQAPVRAAVDSVIGMGLRLAEPLIKRFNKMRDAAKGKVESGKAWVKGKMAQVVVGSLRANLKRIRSSRQLESALAGTLAESRSEGLRRLFVRPASVSGEFTVFGVASPIRPLAKFTPALTLDLRDVDLSQRSNQYVTVASGFLNGDHFATGRNNTSTSFSDGEEQFEQKGRHAETAVLDRLSAMVMSNPALIVRRRHRLELYVTRTPCNDCADRIKRAQKLFASRGGCLDVTVRSLAIYQGSRDAARNEETGGSTKAAGVYSLLRLKQVGVNLEAWDLERDGKRLFGVDVDPNRLKSVASGVSSRVSQLRAALKMLSGVEVR